MRRWKDGLSHDPLQEAAIKWHVSARRMLQLCKEGKIEGALRNGRSWRIPQDAIVPVQESYPATYTAGRLPLPIGVSSYIDAITSYYYVDKTLLIRDFIDTLPKGSLFTRPRRFGKTLNMDMLRTFFEKTTVMIHLVKGIFQLFSFFRLAVEYKIGE